jgi:hypothetical protein
MASVYDILKFHDPESNKSVYRNPLEAGWTEPLEHYKWSSYPAYVQCVGPDLWLQRNRILATAGGAPMLYRAFVERTGDREVDAFYARRRLKPILGGETFIAQVTQDLYHTHVSSDPLSNSAASAPQ